MLGRGDALGGRYVIGVLIASGGMGDVFDAHDRSLHRAVAVKVLRGHGDLKARERFLGEARAAARVTHPNVVIVFDVGDDDRPYLVMERLPGSTLADEMLRGPLTTKRATEVMLQVLDGLDAVHSAGLVHRDVKPGNIFFAEDGTVKLGDFGIVWTGASELTGAGDVVGTAPYIAPERMRGDRPSVASDVYSAGVTLYAALTAAIPFDDNSRSQFLRAAAAGDHVPLQRRRDDVPESLTAVVERAIDPDPTARFPSAASFRDALAAGRVDGASAPLEPATIPVDVGADRPTERAAATATSAMPAAVAPIELADAQAGPGRGRAIAAALMAGALSVLGGIAAAQYRSSSADPILDAPTPATNSRTSPTTDVIATSPSITSPLTIVTVPEIARERRGHGRGEDPPAHDKHDEDD